METRLARLRAAQAKAAASPAVYWERVPTSTEEAKAFVNRIALHDVARLLGAALLLGAGARAGYGLYDLWRRPKRLKEQFSAEEVGHMVFPKSSGWRFGPWAEADRIPLPGWALPVLLLGAPLAMATGWAGIGRWIKHRRKKLQEAELRRVEKEFAAALQAEQKTKFAADLETLSSAYAAGDLEKDLVKTGGILDTVWPLYLTLLLAAAGGGALLGWRGWSKSEKQKEREAFEEHLRRQRINRPLPLYAELQESSWPASEEGEAAGTAGGEASPLFDVVAPKTSAARPRMAKSAAPVGGRWLTPLLSAAAGAGAVGLGGGWWMRRQMSPENLERRLHTFLARASRDPVFAQKLYRSVGPHLKMMFAREHPMLGRLLGWYPAPRVMTAGPAAVGGR